MTIEGSVMTTSSPSRLSNVGLFAHASLLHADTSPLGLGQDHRQTEALLKASGPLIGRTTTPDRQVVDQTVKEIAQSHVIGAGRIGS